MSFLRSFPSKRESSFTHYRCSATDWVPAFAGTSGQSNRSIPSKRGVESPTRPECQRALTSFDHSTGPDALDRDAGDRRLCQPGPGPGDGFAVAAGGSRSAHHRRRRGHGVTAYAVTHGSIQLIIGPISDRFGKYRTVALTCAIGVVLVAVCGMVSTLPQLARARLATGAAAGWVIPISMAYVGDVTPHDRLQQILGRYISGADSRAIVRTSGRRGARRPVRLA